MFRGVTFYQYFFELPSIFEDRRLRVSLGSRAWSLARPVRGMNGTGLRPKWKDNPRLPQLVGKQSTDDLHTPCYVRHAYRWATGCAYAAAAHGRGKEETNSIQQLAKRTTGGCSSRDLSLRPFWLNPIICVDWPLLLMGGRKAFCCALNTSPSNTS